MDNALFLYENYHYLVALYGYYKIISTGYDNYQHGKRIYDVCSGTYKWIFTKPINDNMKNIQIIDNKDWVEIKKQSDKDPCQKDSMPPSHTSHTSVPQDPYVFRPDY